MFGTNGVRGASSLATQAQPVTGGQPSAAPRSHDERVLVEIELSRPLPGHAGPISVITLREPTFGDFIDCGPIRRQIAGDPRASGGMKIEIIEDVDAIMRWINRLSGIPEAILRALSPRDAYAVKSQIAAIFNEFDQGNSQAAPTS